jgi:hypothetical protein
MHSPEFLEQIGAFSGEIVSLARIGLKIKQEAGKKSRLGNVLPATISNGFVQIARPGTEPEERSFYRRPLPCENRREVDPVEMASRNRDYLRCGQNGRGDVHGDRRL